MVMLSKETGDLLKEIVEFLEEIEDQLGDKYSDGDLKRRLNYLNYRIDSHLNERGIPDIVPPEKEQL